MHATYPLLQETDFPVLRRSKLDTVQVNLGYRCNQSCVHCHVNAGPKRSEMMDRETADHVIAFLQRSGASTLDLTGGAPEMNPHFRYMVMAARECGARVIDRCNLTVLEQPGYEDVADFLALQRVEIVASLPCYREENVDRQRGRGVFEASIRALRKLNGLGYGRDGSGLLLNLVFNPGGPVLPPPQQELEAAYKQELKGRYGLVFNRLFALTNMPIQRFGSTLLSQGQFADYLRLLKRAHDPDNLGSVMCRTLINIDWRGHVYDCDFNQMLNLPVGGRRIHISELTIQQLDAAAIATADHCYGCTAGPGSSCGGALDQRHRSTPNRQGQDP